MPAISRRTGTVLTAVALACVMVGPAHADLTAAGVYAAWQDRLERSGGTLRVGRETESEGRVVLRDVVFAAPLPQGRLMAEIDRIDLTEQADGSVILTASDDMVLVVSARAPTLGRIEAVLDLSLPDLSDHVTGTDEATAFRLQAPRISAALRSLRVDGVPVDLTLETALAGLEMSRRVQDGGLDATLGAERLTLEAQGADLGRDGTELTLNARIDDLHATHGADATSLETGLRHGPAEIAGTWRDPGHDSLSLTVSAAAGAQVSEQAAGRVQHSGGLSALEMAATGPRLSALGLPDGALAGRIGRVALGLSGPALPGPTPAPFNLLATITDAEPGDALWAQLDPDAALPRDAADLRLDLAGQMRLGGDGLATLHALELNTLSIDAAGASFTGQGDLVFDPGAPVPAPALPPADGTLTFRFDGANALLEKLVQSGLLGQGQALGAQLMMGFFTVPTGEDSLETVLEFTPDGRITANGQGLR